MEVKKTSQVFYLVFFLLALGLGVLLYGAQSLVLVAQAQETTSTDSTTDSDSTTNATKEEEKMTDEEKKALIEQKEKELKEAEARAEKYGDQADKLTEKVKTLSGMVQALTDDIASTEASIQLTETEIARLEGEIGIMEVEIGKQEKQLEQKRAILGEYLRILDQVSRQSMLEVMLSSESIGDYLKEMGWLSQASGDVKDIYSEIKQQKNLLEIERDKLEEQRSEQDALRLMKEQQRMYLENQRRYKEEVLQETQGEESKYQELLNKEEGVVTKITGELRALQSLGDPINFDDAVAAAKYAAKKTGVRAAYLLGILRVESNMGQNVGGGRYDKDMHPNQRDIFEEICEDLGYDPKDMPVSRKPCYKDKKGNCTGWGGAMGPAQFMPSTWMGYKKSVEAAIGVKQADPWNLKHALVAMGLKVAKVSGVTEGKRSAEHKAASIYLAGGNWESYAWYGDRVMNFSDAFEEVVGKD